MMRIDNRGGLDEKGISSLLPYLSISPDAALAANPRKNQSVFESTLGEKAVIVKKYVHRAFKHRLASFIGQSNADRYSSIAEFLFEKGLPVPRPVVILKSGRGLLPEQTLFAMERADGAMLSRMLPDLENDPAAIRILVEKVSHLIRGLREAGVIHRDLNTKNFLVSEGYEVTLIDFDAASRPRRRGPDFIRRHERDISNFLSTCHGAPRFAAAVATHLNVNL